MGVWKPCPVSNPFFQVVSRFSLAPFYHSLWHLAGLAAQIRPKNDTGHHQKLAYWPCSPAATLRPGLVIVMTTDLPPPCSSGEHP